MTAAIVALGGGHGLYNSLTALRELTSDLTAIVTVADDGGSSGRLRSEMGIVPPGDLRMALSALCADSEWGRTWRDVLQWRFTTDGPLDGHAVGNLLIAALWDRDGDVVGGLDLVASLLQAQGRVLPLADEPLTVRAVIDGPEGRKEIQGQAAVATTAGTVVSLSLEPAQPHVPDETLAAISAADVIVLGPGSWHTSVMTHFAVAPVADALVANAHKCILVLNVGDSDREMEGLGRADEVRALRDAAPDFQPAVALVESAHGDDLDLRSELDTWGVALRVAPLTAGDEVFAHDPAALRRVFARIIAEWELGVRGPSSTMAG
ncbi:uridine diphosphate-N-acetylglucosamine-binding protein YvcK [Demequina sp. B12]|uniref:gluconeogenesis factor YvcK family protein n=1 Tax=Demequina sp. B12 TaxID=2992757 RepID=UPI00237B1BDA|nr:uridine diphosphate-N-acetylglucosamine-binding protein YvcK [Demequina sp. B12]MDE0573161.1 uridine diphosphate-N-acetylglucosamine-binding protein YvcK [Demequina sp. B12]